MNAVELFASSFAVGLSGAMSPGPVLVVVIAESARAGIVASVLMMTGHALLELAMTCGLFFGLQRLRDVPGFEAGLGLLGGAVMLGLAGMMLRSLPRSTLEFPEAGSAAKRVGAGGAIRLMGLGAGISILNPVWTVWWLTIGAGFIATAGVVTVPKAAAFYTGHILSDFAWYVFVGALVVWGRRFLTQGVYRAVLGVLAAVLAAFGAGFLWHGIRGVF